MKKVTFIIAGMYCSGCSSSIERLILKLPGISRAVVDLAGEKLFVEYDPGLISLAEILKFIHRTGFRAITGKAGITVGGLHDSNDALALENLLLSLHGVISAGVNLATEQVNVEFIPGAVSISEVAGLIRKSGFVLRQPDKAGESDDVDGRIRNTELEKQRKMLLLGLLLTFPLIIYSMFRDLSGRGFPYDNYAMLVAATIVQFVVGWQFYAGAFKSLRLGSTNMDVLIVLGSSAAYFSSLLVTIGLIRSPNVYFETAAAIITLIRLGKYLESRAKGRTSEALKAIMGLRPRTATLIKEGTEKEIGIDEVSVGDVLLVKPGEKVPVDGVVCEGHSAIDESMVTGESMPVNKGPGDSVIGATINRDGMIRVEATSIGSNSTLSQIVRMVQEAQAGKPSIQRMTDEIGKYFVPGVILVSLLTLGGWLVVADAGWSHAMICAIAVLVIACPCAIGLATPTAIMVGTAKGAGLGILFRNGEVLERTGRISVIALDKTGTITSGKPGLTDIIALNHLAEDEVLRLAASAEAGSEHPLGRAISAAGKSRGLVFSPVEEFRSVGSYGITAIVGGQDVVIGNQKLMRIEGIDTGSLNAELERLQNEGKTAVVVATGVRGSSEPRHSIGILALADSVKPGSIEAIEEFKEQGLEVVMITGDNLRTAEAVARQVGISRFMADVAPADKASAVKKLQEEGIKTGMQRPVVAMVGDGINDAPALAQADVGIAIGTGTDVAIAAAGITLISGHLPAVGRAISLSRATIETITQNLIWALVYNIALIPIAAYGLLSPMFAAGAMAFSSIFVVTNSLRLSSFRPETIAPRKSLINQVGSILPRIFLPFSALAVLIVIPLLSMPAGMEIRGVRNGNMSSSLMMVMAIANGLIAISYATIPVFLIAFIRKRKDLPFTWAIFLFGLFILACGTTHFVHIIGLWWDVNWWQAFVDSACALISLGTAIVVWPILPKLLAIPSPAQLRIINTQLQTEKTNLEYTQQALRKAYEDVEQKVRERTRDLLMANSALQNEINEHKRTRNEIIKLNQELEQRVLQRTAQLENANRELEAFSYSVSHDLRAPLRGIDGWSLALFEDFYEKLGETGKNYIDRVRAESQHMGRLIDDLLKLSRVTRTELKTGIVDLSSMASKILAHLTDIKPERKAAVNIQQDLVAEGDPSMIEIALTNLFDNAMKFTLMNPNPVIEFGCILSEGNQIFFVRDNGVGFDMAYSKKLFGAFQRLHKQSDFPGSGIGLATVQRIINRHNGRIWAESKPNEGTTFYFTLKP